MHKVIHRFYPGLPVLGRSLLGLKHQRSEIHLVTKVKENVPLQAISRRRTPQAGFAVRRHTVQPLCQPHWIYTLEAPPKR